MRSALSAGTRRRGPGRLRGAVVSAVGSVTVELPMRSASWNGVAVDAIARRQYQSVAGPSSGSEVQRKETRREA